MQVIKQVFLAAVFSLLAINAHAAAVAAPAAAPATPDTSAAAASTTDVSGTYQCQGYDPFGKSDYNYPTAVFTKNGDTYNIQWQSSTGYPLLLGTGLFNKDVSNAFAVVFWDPKKPDYFGAGLYTVKPDGSMQAVWTLQAQKQIGTEVCTKVNKT